MEISFSVHVRFITFGDRTKTKIRNLKIIPLGQDLNLNIITITMTYSLSFVTKKGNRKTGG